ncbi:HYR domain-containing protein, partial [Salinimicrobium oceani]
TEGTYIHIFAYDQYNNESSSCSFEVVLVEEDQPSFDCDIPPGTLDLDENCDYSESDFSDLIINRQHFENGIFIDQTEEREGDLLRVSLRVYHGEDENSDFIGECNFQISLTDTTAPQISCPGPKTANFNPEVGFIVPDYSGEVLVFDNCNPDDTMEVIQDPVQGEVIYGSQQISFTVYDDSGNPAECEFQLTLEEEETGVPLEITGCPDPQQGSLDGYCTFTIPDYTGEVSTNIPANITQVPTPGSSIYQDTRVSVIATTSMGEVDICYVEITLDTSLPSALNCPPSIEEADYYPDQGYFIGSYLSRYHLDFCDRNFTVVQTPEFGTLITEDTPVQIRVSD